MKATYQRIKQVFYWPGMKKEVEKYVLHCPVYHKNKGEHYHDLGLLDPLHILDIACTNLSMDFIEGLPKSNEKETIYVVVDRLTKCSLYTYISPLYSEWPKLS